MLPLLILAAPALTFGFFGCNRVDAADIDPVANPSSANVAQLRQTFSEVGRANIPLLFAGGDLVNNYGDDKGVTLRRQLNAWTTEASYLPVSTNLVVVPGNHELNRKSGGKKLPEIATYPVWQAWTHNPRFFGGINGPKPSEDPADALVTDESMMSYTIDRAGVRFIVLNTDTRTSTTDPATGTSLGWIPWHWAGEQLQSAESDPRIRAVFVLGHRNLVDPAKGVGDAPIDKVAADHLLTEMRGKKKLNAYVCAHVHAWDVRPIPGTAALQIISGDGGSKLEDDAKEEFGWVEIRVYPDGHAGYIHHHRPMPHPYNSPKVELPTVEDPEVRV